MTRFFLVHTSCVCSILTKYVFLYTVTKLDYVAYHVWYFKSFLFSQKILRRSLVLRNNMCPVESEVQDRGKLKILF